MYDEPVEAVPAAPSLDLCCAFSCSQMTGAYSGSIVLKQNQMPGHSAIAFPVSVHLEAVYEIRALVL